MQNWFCVEAHPAKKSSLRSKNNRETRTKEQRGSQGISVCLDKSSTASFSLSLFVSFNPPTVHLSLLHRHWEGTTSPQNDTQTHTPNQVSDKNMTDTNSSAVAGNATASPPTVGTKRPNDGAISLLEKYTAINRGIDEARRETAEIQHQTDQARTAIEQKQQEGQRMTQQLQRTAENLPVPPNDRTALERVQAALRAKTRAEQRLSFWKRRRQDEARNFLEMARAFRNKTKRLRWQHQQQQRHSSRPSDGHDVSAIVSYCFLETHGCQLWNKNTNSGRRGVAVGSNRTNDDTSHDENDQDDDNEEQEQEDWTAEALCRPNRNNNNNNKRKQGHNRPNGTATDSNDDHDTNNDDQAATAAADDDDDDDPELSEVQASFRKAHSAYGAAKKELNAVKRVLNKAKKESDGRQNRQGQLQKQLDRVRNDCRALEDQLASIEEETKEATAMAESYKNRTESCPSPSAPAAATTRTTTSTTANHNNNNNRNNSNQNPYARTKNNTAGRRNMGQGSKANKKAATKKRKSQPRPYLMEHRTALQRQHPHLTGRIRRQKQFDSGLAVIGGAEVLYDDESNHHSNNQDGEKRTTGQWHASYNVKDNDDV